MPDNKQMLKKAIKTGGHFFTGQGDTVVNNLGS